MVGEAHSLPANGSLDAGPATTMIFKNLLWNTWCIWLACSASGLALAQNTTPEPHQVRREYVVGTSLVSSAGHLGLSHQ